MRSKLRFSIITLGCKVNQFESEAMEKALSGKGHTRYERGTDCDGMKSPRASTADICIINTCAVTSKAAMQSRQAIRKAMRENPGANIVVTGCYAQSSPKEIASIKGVHHILGHGEKNAIPEKIGSLMENVPDAPRIVRENISSGTPFRDMPATPMGNRTRPFLKIQDGCNAFCTYCIVPHARGPSRSMPDALVLEKIRKFADAGYREVVLTGIHLGAYGKDLDPAGTLFDLLLKIRKLDLIDRVRLSSIEPNEINDDIIGLASDWTGLCDHFHIPLQSGDNGVLKRMKRPYDRDFFMGRVEKIKELLPRAAIGVDTLIGFPGETREAFENTRRLIEILPVTYLHVFPFSPRRGTPAWNFPEKVDSDTVKKRCREMRRLGNEKKKAFYESLLGEPLEILVEERLEGETGLLKGVSSNYVPVLIQGEDSLKSRIITVRIEKMDGNNRVFGTVLED